MIWYCSVKLMEQIGIQYWTIGCSLVPRINIASGKSCIGASLYISWHWHKDMYLFNSIHSLKKNEDFKEIVCYSFFKTNQRDHISIRLPCPINAYKDSLFWEGLRQRTRHKNSQAPTVTRFTKISHGPTKSQLYFSLVTGITQTLSQGDI